MRSKKKSFEIDMCSGAILPKMLQFSLPLMASSILQLLFNAADIIVVGRFAGDNALAAVGSNSSIVNLLCNLFIGLSVGANILASRQYGAKDYNGLRQTVHTSISLSLISGIFLAIVGAFGSKGILILMQSPAGVRDLAALYLRIYFLGMPAVMIYNFGAAILRAAGDTRRPLYYLTIAGVINVILNLFFVIVCHMDVAGVALATVLSECISAVLVIRCMIQETGPIHLDIRQLHISPVRLKQILHTGIPAGLQGMLFSLSNVAIQSAVNSFGEIVVAGNAAATNIEAFIYTAMNAFYQATISFTSQNLGSGNHQRIWPIQRRALICVISVGIVAGGLAALFGPQLLGIYSDSPAVIAAGVNRLNIICTTYFICGIMEIMVGSLRGIGQAIMPMLVSLIGACGIRLLVIATIFQLPQFHTIETVYWTYPLSWMLTTIAHFICFLIAMRKLKKHFAI